MIISPDKCSGSGGCRACVTTCPYKAIHFNEDLKIAQKCTGCAHLLDNGYKVPRCVESCPTDALRFGEENELKMFIEGAGVLKPETGCSPRVYYRLGIEACGFRAEYFSDLNTSRDVNLGDMPLEKER